jgi:hypothetical protein
LIVLFGKFLGEVKVIFRHVEKLPRHVEMASAFRIRKNSGWRSLFPHGKFSPLHVEKKFVHLVMAFSIWRWSFPCETIFSFHVAKKFLHVENFTAFLKEAAADVL